MRNPNRTTKCERRFIRRYNPYAARVLGIAQAARWYRDGVLLDEARGFDNILNDLKYGTVPLDLNDRVNAAIDGQRDALERKLGVGPGMLTPTSSNVNHYSVHEPMFDLTADEQPRIGTPIIVTYNSGAHEFDNWFAKYQAYREGRDPNEVAAVHAEAIEHALNDDIDPGD